MAGLFSYVLFGDLALKIPPVPGHLFEYGLILYRDRVAIGDLPNFGNGVINKAKITQQMRISNNVNSPALVPAMHTLLDRIDDLVAFPLMTVEHVIAAMAIHKDWKNNQQAVANGSMLNGELIVALPFEFKAGDMHAMMGWELG